MLFLMKTNFGLSVIHFFFTLLFFLLFRFFRLFASAFHFGSAFRSFTLRSRAEQRSSTLAVWFFGSSRLCFGSFAPRNRSKEPRNRMRRTKTQWKRAELREGSAEE
uniref:Uncharacterized protein n=1 Tax=Lacunastrum gracillimum TaxID=427913 RepID=A0A2U8GHK4_9CHLO|nr:hypothetical protein [Lacunastrum gracillimum]AWI68068.1 hypothetical protein [Lacunastrum gracillimum]